MTTDQRDTACAALDNAARAMRAAAETLPGIDGAEWPCRQRGVLHAALTLEVWRDDVSRAPTVDVQTGEATR
jgi:hypothetical protein